MTLAVAPVNNPAFGGIGAPPKQTITSTMVATPGSNGFAGLVPTPTSNAALKTATTSSINASNDYASQTNALLAAIARLQNSQPRQVYAPKLDFAAINSQARSAAEGAVNPYYTKQLNDYLAQQSALKSQSEAQTATNVKNLQEDLATKLQGNDITGARTAEDTATKIGDINTAADQFQTDSGQQFATDRLQQGRDIAKAGLTGGLGAQQQEASALAHNTTEARQTAQTDQQKASQELFKARTFEDLSRSSALATTEKERGVKQANVSLADFIANQNFDTEAKKSQLESQRLQAVGQEQGNQGRLLVNNFINSIADPASRGAAVQAYGGLF